MLIRREEVLGLAKSRPALTEVPPVFSIIVVISNLILQTFKITYPYFCLDILIRICLGHPFPKF